MVRGSSAAEDVQIGAVSWSPKDSPEDACLRVPGEARPGRLKAQEPTLQRQESCCYVLLAWQRASCQHLLALPSLPPPSLPPCRPYGVAGVYADVAGLFRWIDKQVFELTGDRLVPGTLPPQP